MAEISKVVTSSALIEWAHKRWQEAIEHAEAHCWRCDAEVGEYEDGDVCPDCGTDLVPF